MKLLICGDRNWTNLDMIVAALKVAKRNCPDLVVIHGAARGADSLAGQAADELGIPTISMPANWKKYGRAAGPIRNQAMLDENPNEVWAFHNELRKSKGTADMVSRSRRKKVPVLVFSEAESTQERTQNP